MRVVLVPALSVREPPGRAPVLWRQAARMGVVRPVRTSAMIRLQKYLAQCGVASRRHAERLIAHGRVTVNGEAAQLGDSVDPSLDSVAVDGDPIRPDRHVYILLNKPRGVITSVKDTHRRRTVIDCLSGINERVFPVGRLDMDVEGALILTNDGELAYRLMHPKHQIDRVYLAWVVGSMTPAEASRLSKGVALDDGPTAPAEVVVRRTTKDATLVQLTLREGRKREVKRLCTAVGHPVRELRRTAVGNVRIRGLAPGEWRHLRPTELEGLRKLAGLAAPRHQRS